MDMLESCLLLYFNSMHQFLVIVFYSMLANVNYHKELTIDSIGDAFRQMD